MPGDVIPLGARLKQRREQLGLSQTEAASQLAVARTAYRLWEMEAARPAPDRWRVIAKWLGVSMTALLLAGELLDEEEALEAEQIVGDAGFTTDEWDTARGVSPGDFFSRQRAMIGDQVAAGKISSEDATRLRHVVTRMQGRMSDANHGWHPGRFVKRLPSTLYAPALARAALLATTTGIPDDAYDRAAVLTSELVTNAVQHSVTDWIDVEIRLDTDELCIKVSDEGTQSVRPRTPGSDGGWGLVLIGELATRWGVERHSAGKTVWIELDLTTAAA
jgi:anti-sigma regulatory factor (Ser/Thr protein kinase)/transcriptional regulator with XRE-family HTH domain